MKILAMSLLTVFSSLAMADLNSASEVFMASVEVQQKITEAKAKGLEVANTPEEATLAGGCGFAGCDSVTLVTLAVYTKGANPQTDTISAIIRMGPNGISGKVIETAKILELAH